MTYATPISKQKPKKKPKGVLIAALVFLLLGIGGCGFAAAKVGPYVSDLLDFATDLDRLGRVVPMGEEVSFTSSGSKGIALLSEEAVCTGEGPSGPVTFDAYESFGPTTSVDLGGVRMRGYILFDIETGSEYTIRCGDGSSFGSYTSTTAPSFLVEGARGVIGGTIVGFAGAFFVFISFILFIIGLVQRSSWKKKQNQGPPASGGWGAPAQQVPPAPAQGGASGWSAPPAPGQGAPGGWSAPPAPPQQAAPPAPQGLPQQPPTQQPPPPPMTPPPVGGGDQPPPPPPLR